MADGLYLTVNVCVVAERGQNDSDTHFDRNVSLVLRAQVTGSSREHLLYV